MKDILYGTAVILAIPAMVGAALGIKMAAIALGVTETAAWMVVVVLLEILIIAASAVSIMEGTSNE